MKYLIIISLFATTTIVAQTIKNDFSIYQDNNITWGIETLFYIDFEDFSTALDNPFYLYQNILTDAFEMKMPIYCPYYGFESNPYSKKGVLSIRNREQDTMLQVDPVTLEEEYILYEKVHNPGRVKSLGVKQVFYYDTLSSTLKTHIIGYAPIEHYPNSEYGPENEQSPLFWAGKNFDFNKTKKNKKKDRWVAQTDIIYDFSSGDPAHRIKKTGGLNLAENFIKEIEQGNLIAYRDSIEYKIDPIADAYVSWIDTILVIDSVTLEERYEIEIYEAYLPTIHKYQIIQNWFYNRKTHLLTSEILAVGPVEDFEDELDEDTTLFLIYFNEDAIKL
jgi:hypothetical protein